MVEEIFSNQGKVSISYGFKMTRKYSIFFFVTGTNIIVLPVKPRNKGE